jgi:hypothetical protein
MKMAEQPNPKPEREIDIERELVYEAFDIVPGGRLELEKKILAVAFLLESCCEEGNADLNASIALGLSEVLRLIAKDAALLRRQLQHLESETEK